MKSSPNINHIPLWLTKLKTTTHSENNSICSRKQNHCCALTVFFRTACAGEQTVIHPSFFPVLVIITTDRVIEQGTKRIYSVLIDNEFMDNINES